MGRASFLLQARASYRRRERIQMDALKLLKEDHDKVKGMLEKLDSTTTAAEVTRTNGLVQLKKELTVHETIEEEILYPALKEFAKTKDIALEAYEEHHVMDTIMAELDATPVADETWAAKLTVMRENLGHHIEEEEGEMFEQARKVMDEDELSELGERMASRKGELQRS
jgi:hemerythrin-like domain-containing protein